MHENVSIPESWKMLSSFDGVLSHNSIKIFRFYKVSIIPRVWWTW